MDIYWNASDIFALRWQKNPVRGETGCVYMVVGKASREVLYIGQTGHPRVRLCPSVHPAYRQAEHDLYILRVSDRHERKYIEARCIEILRPVYNRRAGSCQMDEDVKSACYDRVFNH